jgi:hypothetical protein
MNVKRKSYSLVICSLFSGSKTPVSVKAMLLMPFMTFSLDAYSHLVRSNTRSTWNWSCRGILPCALATRTIPSAFARSCSPSILAWLGSGADLLGLLREWYKDRKDPEEKRKQKLHKHTKILNDQVYKKLLHIFITTDRAKNKSKSRVVKKTT